tara:strand:+ start:18970 stop:19230 length:261 start_codon:yes stop_codon:yes gene_type:complete
MTTGTISSTKSFELDEDTWEEIISILAKNGRPDLIEALKASNDDDYLPTAKDKRNKEYFEYYDGSEGEEYDQSDVSVDANGFWSLK